MASASQPVFIFIFIAIAVTSFIGLAAFITSNNTPTMESTASTTTVYMCSTALVNQTMATVGNITAQGTTIISPLPMLAMIFAVAVALMVMILVVKKRG